MISKKLSDAFQVTYLYAIILVVAIHYNTKKFIDISGDIPVNFLIQEFITNGIARTAVPFFALSAGFFFFYKFKALHDYYPLLKKRIRTIVIPYLLASTFIFAIEFLYHSGYKGIDFPINPLRDILLAPLAIQFWFLRDLLILLVISPFIWLLTRYLGVLFILVIVGFWLVIDVEFMPYLEGRRLITIETLAFFSLGCWLSLNIRTLELLVDMVSRRQLAFLLLAYTALLSYRMYLDPFFSDDSSQAALFPLLLQNTSIILGMFILLTINYQGCNKRILALSSYTFFVFLFHELPLNRLIVKFSDYFILDAYKFYFIFPAAVILTLLLAIMLEKLLPTVYMVVTGGRGKNTVLKRINS